nr:restriction endonuclease subunit S [Leptotrichiaceae bacterium]
MSKIEQLIKELCPNGVEYNNLGELGVFLGGITGKSKEDFTNGNSKFITYKNIYSNPSLKIDVEDKVRIFEGEKQNTLEYGDVLFTGSSETPEECGISSVLTIKTDEELFLNSFCFIFRFNNKSLMIPNFSKHLFRSPELRYKIIKTANGVTRFNISKKLMNKIKIPIPPLQVQREIVRILDTFSEYTTELTTELTMRKKQYEYYRDNLFSFDSCEYEQRLLGEIGEVR